jgi:hypothetical protein
MAKVGGGGSAGKRMAKVGGGGSAGKRLVPVARAQIVANSLARRTAKPTTTTAFSRAHRTTARASTPAIPKPPTTTAKARVGQTVTDAMRNAPAARKALAGVLRKQ